MWRCGFASRARADFFRQRSTQGDFGVARKTGGAGAAARCDLSARIDRLENAQRNQLELANQTETLRQEIARLRGQIEALTNEVATLQKRNRDLYADLDARLKKMEPSNVTVDGRPVAVERPEQGAYEAALSQFRASDFKGALASFQQFVARYPQSPYVPVAHYWIGSSHYALKEYKSAIAAQQILVDKYSDSTRAPDALLSIAESQLQLGDKKSANRTLGRLIKDYPDSEAAKVARERLPATKLASNCRGEDMLRNWHSCWSIAVRERYLSGAETAGHAGRRDNIEARFRRDGRDESEDRSAIPRKVLGTRSARRSSPACRGRRSTCIARFARSTTTPRRCAKKSR